MSNRPEISVCLLVYNHVNIVASTIDTILAQTRADFELIVSDDCSTDGTWELLQSICSGDPRIQVIRTHENIGMAGNANFAVEAASGEYVALLHHDDLYSRDLLEQWASTLDRYPDVGFVFNSYAIEGNNQISSIAIPEGRLNGTWFLFKHLFPHWGCPIHGTAMIRRAAWDRAGGMRLEFSLLADVDLWMRLSAAGPVAYVDKPLITVRHERPSYYPDIYKGGTWSWPRQRFLYEIHAANRLEQLNLRTVKGKVEWWWFRIRVSTETMKWLIYALIRRNDEMLLTSEQCVTAYDLPPLTCVRSILHNRAKNRAHDI